MTGQEATAKLAASSARDLARSLTTVALGCRLSVMSDETRLGIRPTYDTHERAAFLSEAARRLRDKNTDD